MNQRQRREFLNGQRQPEPEPEQFNGGTYLVAHSGAENSSGEGHI